MPKELQLFLKSARRVGLGRDRKKHGQDGRATLILRLFVARASSPC